MAWYKCGSHNSGFMYKCGNVATVALYINVIIIWLASASVIGLTSVS